MTVEQEIKIQASYAYDDGFSDGVSHGISEGISQGSHDKAVETAGKMIEKDMSFDDIGELTGLSMEEIERIAASH